MAGPTYPAVLGAPLAALTHFTTLPPYELHPHEEDYWYFRVPSVSPPTPGPGLAPHPRSADCSHTP
jgi:hypothetical protein